MKGRYPIDQLDNVESKRPLWTNQNLCNQDFNLLRPLPPSL